MSQSARADSLAGRYQDGERAKEKITDALYDILDFEFEISTDEYDNSLEVYVGEDAPVEFAVTREIADKIYSFGFALFWFNWPDGTDQCCMGERKPKSKPFAES